MSDAQFVCGDPGSDRGGVHSNSGVPNDACALMVDGGSYSGFTVTGIGLTKAGEIPYRWLAYCLLLSASDFLDDYLALKLSCEDLIGVAGITTADCTEVGDADVRARTPTGVRSARIAVISKSVGQGRKRRYGNMGRWIRMRRRSVL